MKAGKILMIIAEDNCSEEKLQRKKTAGGKTGCFVN